MEIGRVEPKGASHGTTNLYQYESREGRVPNANGDQESASLNYAQENEIQIC